MKLFRSSRSVAVVLETLPVAPGRLATQLKAGLVPLVNSPFTKKKSLSLMIGPPTRKPWVSTLKGVLGMLSVLLATFVPARSLLFQKRQRGVLRQPALMLHWTEFRGHSRLAAHRHGTPTRTACVRCGRPVPDADCRSHHRFRCSGWPATPAGAWRSARHRRRRH